MNCLLLLSELRKVNPDFLEAFVDLFGIDGDRLIVVDVPVELLQGLVDNLGEFFKDLLFSRHEKVLQVDG
jgi:hypothetical protein